MIQRSASLWPAVSEFMFEADLVPSGECTTLARDDQAKLRARRSVMGSYQRPSWVPPPPGKTPSGVELVRISVARLGTLRVLAGHSHRLPGERPSGLPGGDELCQQNCVGCVFCFTCTTQLQKVDVN